jgi:hypothetical protein
VCQSLWCEKGCSFRPLLSAYRGTRMKVSSHTSNRSTKRSNLIRQRPLTNRRDLIRADFRGAGIQFATPQCFARTARGFSYRPRNRSRLNSSSPSRSSKVFARRSRRGSARRVELNRMALTILDILNQKYHQECDDQTRHASAQSTRQPQASSGDNAARETGTVETPR